MEYLFVILLTLYLAYHYDYRGYNKNKDVWYRVLFAIIVFLIGFRYRIGLDTVTYLGIFYDERTPLLNEISIDTLEDSLMEPGYMLVTSLVKTLFGRFYVVQLLHAIFVTGLIFNYFKKHTRYIFTCVLIFIIWRILSYETEEMRASIAIVICLYANDYAIQRKWLKCIVLILIAFSFHISAFVLLFTPFTTFLRFNRWGFLMLAGSLVAGFVILELFGDLMELFDITSQMESRANGYAIKDMSESSKNIYGILSALITYLLYTLISVKYLKKHKPSGDILKLQSNILLGLMFVFISFPVYIFYRFVHFYEVYFMILYSELIITYLQNNRSSPIIKLSYFAPFFFLIVYSYWSVVPYNKNLRTYMRYYPYNSIFFQDRNKNTEKLFSEYRVFYDSYENY